MQRFPHTDPILLGGTPVSARNIVERLGPHLTDSRRAKIDRILADRTCSIVPVLEGLYDRGNISAVLRSAEALGFQSVHIIETVAPFKKANRVTQGAEKWLDISCHGSTKACVDSLRAHGYRIIAAHVQDAVPIDEVPFEDPAAIVFGNEHEGLSDALLAEADLRMKIPMTGFTQSFNISVAAALTLYHVRKARERCLGRHGDLTEAEQACLRAVYYLRSAKFAGHVLAHPTRTPETAP